MSGVLLLVIRFPHQHGGRSWRSDILLQSSLVEATHEVRCPAQTVVLQTDGQLRVLLPGPSYGPLQWLHAFDHRSVTNITICIKIKGTFLYLILRTDQSVSHFTPRQTCSMKHLVDLSGKHSAKLHEDYSYTTNHHSI